MGQEIEAKMRLADRAALESALRRRGAAAGPVIHEDNTLFDTPEQRLRDSDQGLRLRVERDGAGNVRSILLTHKGPRAAGDVKNRAETEVAVGDRETMAALLGSLGFAPVLRFQKVRARWELEGCHVDIDRLPLLGQFVEVEGPTQEAVLAVRDRLGLSGEAMIRESYIGLLLSELENRGIASRDVRLER